MVCFFIPGRSHYYVSHIFLYFIFKQILLFCVFMTLFLYFRLQVDFILYISCGQPFYYIFLTLSNVLLYYCSLAKLYLSRPRSWFISCLLMFSGILFCISWHSLFAYKSVLSFAYISFIQCHFVYVSIVTFLSCFKLDVIFVLF